MPDPEHRWLRNKNTREAHLCEKMTPACQEPDDPMMHPDTWEYLADIGEHLDAGGGLCAKCAGEFAKE